jgi:ubiquinone/menaquinone biosynthesis C-methylase UbiE
MKTPIDYIAINKASWNKRTQFHIDSTFYDMDSFMKGNTSLNDIELSLLGDVQGKKILHLQCHFGQDSISLSRMGAIVTGVDLSDIAIEKARNIAQQENASTQFICCDLYDLPNILNEKFDIVFTSYGTIGWLPDIHKWAAIIARYLNPGGKFVFAEFHPVVWMFDDAFKDIAYNYFNTGPIIETENGTYADRTAAINQDYVMWNHSLSEVINSLLHNQLQMQQFHEYDYSPYNCFANTVAIAAKKYRIKHLEDKIPMAYALIAQKR